ncbi:MAG: tRNA (adenosine(37)-N6)-threonylcarbamoyltransferase complex dimerization subunit type 1 TsaB [Cumulibacter sp.]
MKILAIDTSSAHIASGIVEVTDTDITTLAESATTGATMHAEVLAPSIEQASHAAGVPLAELDGIVVGLGPGPFTGLRVGIVTAASISDALGVPVWGVGSLDAVAVGASGPTLVVSDARRKEVYFAWYDGDRRIDGPDVRRPEDLEARGSREVRVVHAGASKYLAELQRLGADVIERYPTPYSLVRLAVRDGLVGGPSNTLEPIYLRRPDAAEPKPKPRLDVTGPTGR